MKPLKKPAPLLKRRNQGWVIVHATDPRKAVGRIGHASRQAAISHFIGRSDTPATWAAARDEGFNCVRVHLAPKNDADSGQ